jgi:hypothetical protein
VTTSKLLFYFQKPYVYESTQPDVLLNDWFILGFGRVASQLNNQMQAPRYRPTFVTNCTACSIMRICLLHAIGIQHVRRLPRQSAKGGSASPGRLAASNRFVRRGFGSQISASARSTLPDHGIRPSITIRSLARTNISHVQTHG